MYVSSGCAWAHITHRPLMQTFPALKSILESFSDLADNISDSDHDSASIVNYILGRRP